MCDCQVGVTQVRHALGEQAEAGISLNSKIKVLCLHLQQLIWSLALRITPVAWGSSIYMNLWGRICGNYAFLKILYSFPYSSSLFQQIFRSISQGAPVIFCAQIWALLCRIALQTTKRRCSWQLYLCVFPRLWHQICHSFLPYSQFRC